MNGSLAGSGGGWQPESVIIPLVYLIIFLVGTVGNSLVLAVLLRNGQVKNTTNLFILNLGVADLCFILFCVPFQATIYTLWQSVDPLQDMSESKKAKRKVTRMIIIVAVLFCLCWLPHHLVILCMWFGYFPLNHTTYVLRILSHVISYANSCVNPIVYALVSKHFRKGFKKIFSCLLHKKAARKVHVAQAANTVSTLEAELSEVTQLSEVLPGRSTVRCRVPAQPWGQAELVGQQQGGDGSSDTFNVS